MMRTRLLTHTILGMFLLSSAAAIAAQEQKQETKKQDETKPETAKPSEEKPAKPTPLKLFRDAYEITKTADSTEAYGKVIQLCQDGIELEPEGKHVGYGKTLLAWAQNRRGEAITAAAEADPAGALAAFEAAVANDPTKWKYFHNRGISYAETGQLEKALSDVNKVLEMQPNFANAHYNQGELYFQLGQFENAVTSYGQAIRLAPRDAAAYNNRGFAYYRQGNTRAAEQDFNRALQLDSNHVEALVSRGNLYLDRGRFAEGMRDLQRAISLNENFSPALISLAWFRATCPVAQHRSSEAAIGLANKAIKLNGETPRFLDTLAAAHARSADFEKAVAAQKKALELDAENEAYQKRLELYEAGKAYTDTLSGSQ